MHPDQLLTVFSLFFIGSMVLLVVVPYLRGRSDLVSAWNFFLVGSANFVGASAIGAASSGSHYTEYTDLDYLRFFAGVITFYTVLVVTYHGFKWPRRMAGRALLKWPPVTVPVLYMMVPIAMLFVLGMMFPPPIPGLLQFIHQMGMKAIIFTMVLAFVAWYRQRYNPILIATWPTILFLALILGITTGTGRRLMVAAVLAIPMCLYWLRWRYRKPLQTLVAAGCVSVAFVMVMGAYTQVRHRGRGEHVARDFGYAIKSLGLIWSNLLNPGTEKLLGQNAAECSLLCIHMYTHDRDAEPFHSLVFVLVNPIPRSYWPSKPVGLGYSLPKDCHKLYKTPWLRATWGPGIIGHGYHEGGLVMLVFYGILVGSCLRFFDELLMRQPGNPYLLGGFIAVSGHVIGWPRGDIGTFTIHIISGMIMVLLVQWIGRLLFGTGLIYPRTSDFDVTKHGYVPR